MNATEAYMEYCAIKAHFERASYDYYKYNGKVRAGNYDDRKDKNFFFRLSRAYNKQQLHEYYIANFLDGNKWVGNMTKDNWLAWKAKIVRLPEVFNSDTKAIRQLVDERHIKVKDVFQCKSGEHPILLKLLMGDFIQVESFVLLDRLMRFHNAYDRRMKNDPIWPDRSIRIRKYGSMLLREFVGDKVQFTKIAVKNLLNTP